MDYKKSIVLSNKPLSSNERQSNFELLRIISLIYIVLYHILLYFIYPTSHVVFFKSIQLLLHIGVINFVLISGFFGIKPSIKGIVKLLSLVLVYSIPEIVYNICHANNLKEVVKSFLFISHTHYWFIRTYLFLYLISPLLNLWIEKATIKQQLYLLLALSFICIYIGTTLGDNTLSNGKNVINFSFIYLIGNMINLKQNQLKKFTLKYCIILYVLLNLLLISSYYLMSTNIVGIFIWQLSFPYCSPLLIVNSILFFMIFLHLKVHSKAINYLSKSCLAIYLIHESTPFVLDTIGFVSKSLYFTINNSFFLLIVLVLFSVLIACVAIAIDKLLTPVWYCFNLLGDKLTHFVTRNK